MYISTTTYVVLNVCRIYAELTAADGYPVHMLIWPRKKWREHYIVCITVLEVGDVAAL